MTRLVVLARPPAHGRAKTRLAADLGAGPATQLARAMLSDSWRAVCRIAEAEPSLHARLALCDEPAAYPLLSPAPATEPQGAGDLGARMARLAARAGAAGSDVLLLGTDSPGLAPTHLSPALAQLAQHDLLLGPVPDGGFWCLGLGARAAARLGEHWLDGLDWSDDETLAPVRARAEQLGLDVGLAAEGYDLDRAADLPALATRLELAPAMARLLGEHPEWLGAAGSGRPPQPPRTPQLPQPREALVSIIVASLDEGPTLEACLRSLREQPGPLEIVVSDGGSGDDGPERAAAAGHVVLRGPPGRGRQLAAGAELAAGEALLFLHVDVALPPRALDLVRETLTDHEAGAFVTRTAPDPGLANPLGPLLRLADLRSRFTRHPYGDQALFCRRDAYDAAGGFRALPIMEDYDLAQRLARRQPIARLATPVTVSGRRMQQQPLRSALLMRLIPPLFRWGVDPWRLASWYHMG